jgi:putative ABC transport system permease protein
VCGRFWFWKGLLKDVNPIDKIISIRGQNLKSLVLKEKGSTFGNSQDLRVLIPIQLHALYSQRLTSIIR